MSVFVILIVVMNSQVYTYVKIYPLVYFKYEMFIGCQLYSIRLFLKISIIAKVMLLNTLLVSFCKRNKNTAETSLPPNPFPLLPPPTSFPKSNPYQYVIVLSMQDFTHFLFHARFYTFPVCVH